MVLAFPSGLDYLPVNCGGIFGRGFGENIFILGGGKRGGIMKIIKNSEGLAKLVSKDKDLILDEDIRIEFEPTKTEFRDVKCRNLFLMNDNQRFDFNGRNFTGGNFTGGDFTGWHFNGGDFNGGNFTGGNFTGRNFNGGNFTGGDFNGGNFTGRNFTGRNFTGWNFNGRNFNGWHFNGGNFTGGDFNGGNFTGRNFTGRAVTYYAFFNCYSSIKCESITGRRNPCHLPICLEGKLEIIKR